MKKFHIPRSQSCPHLFMDDDNQDEEEEAKIIPNIKHRERAFSECIKMRQRRRQSSSSMTLNRPQSDSDLSHIDREKTFAFDARRAAVEPGELLVKVAIALGGFRTNITDENMTVASVDGRSHLGVHGFSDSQILASEQQYSDWSTETSEKSYNTPAYGRSRRALSEIRIPIEESVKVTNLMLHLAPFQKCLRFSFFFFFSFFFCSIRIRKIYPIIFSILLIVHTATGMDMVRSKYSN